MRQEVAAKKIALIEHVGHALNRRQIEIAITIDDANLGSDDLKVRHHGVEW
jgi:hypothetical protein